ncbi:GerW family sporulation protein [Gracilibacillus thailandensis]|uniref:Sporulation protein YtfJ n=1 Tax=Gracilibacillus thailandensis TaxID=563735 RepID=A0A6N7R2J6_9BACI|nr:GerW family sporulation protein [Gracilibacillus thailandensis]MRI65226.1 sporulation protein YtfJ [Gracilibacillus thailandensis]
MEDNNQNVHPLEGFMNLTMANLKQLIEVDTAIGKPIEVPDGSLIIPLSKVKFGFAAGGSEFVPGGGQDQQGQESGKESGQGDTQSESIIPFGGGSGGGVSIIPSAFVIANKEGVQLLPLNESTTAYEKVLEKSPQVIDQVLDMLKQRKDEKQQGNDI